MVARHEHSSTALIAGAFASYASDLAIVVNLVELEDSELVLKFVRHLETLCKQQPSCACA